MNLVIESIGPAAWLSNAVLTLATEKQILAGNGVTEQQWQDLLSL